MLKLKYIWLSASFSTFRTFYARETQLAILRYSRKINIPIEWRSHYVVLPWYQNIWISTNRDPANMAEKKKNNDMYDFSMHDFTQEQNGSPYYSSIVRHCKCPSLRRKVVAIQNTMII